MAKRNRTKSRDQQPTTAGAVGPRQPCPCGSGKRYKACHGGSDQVYVARPFEGLVGECDVVALRELVPAATAPLPLRDSDRTVQLCTLLPGAAPAMVRASGDIWLGLQVQHNYGDIARDLGAVLTAALEAETGVVGLTTPPGAGPRLQDLVAEDLTTLDITVHDGFDYWVADDAESAESAAVKAALEQANAAAMPSYRLGSVDSSYWTDVSTKEHLRWVMPEPEGELLDALARLHVRGDDVLVPDSRLVGMFRAHGLLVPVWDLAVGTGAEALEEPAAAFKQRLDEVLAEGAELNSEERAARNGLANRQVTIR